MFRAMIQTAIGGFLVEAKKEGTQPTILFGQQAELTMEGELVFDLNCCCYICTVLFIIIII